MSMYNMFRLRVKGSANNCKKFAMALSQYSGHSDDPAIVAESDTSDNHVAEIRGALCGNVSKYMIETPSDENSLKGLSKALDLEIEVFASDPDDGGFEYYYYKNGELIHSCEQLPNNLPDFMFDNMVKEEDRQKYDKSEEGLYELKKEYLPDAEWDYDEDEMICNFKIVME